MIAMQIQLHSTAGYCKFHFSPTYHTAVKVYKVDNNYYRRWVWWSGHSSSPPTSPTSTTPRPTNQISPASANFFEPETIIGLRKKPSDIVYDNEKTSKKTRSN